MPLQVKEEILLSFTGMEITDAYMQYFTILELDFKLIHQRQFDKMESINDYVVKKEAKREAFRVAYEQGARSLRENKIRTRQMVGHLFQIDR